MPGYKWLFDNKPLDISEQEKNGVWKTLEYPIQMLRLLMLKQ
jgi:hypothetical protein